MPAAVWALYEYARSVSHVKGIFFSNARRTAWELGINKNTVTSWTRELENKGWFVRQDKGKRLKRNHTSGMFTAIRYRVLDHDAWVKLHPGKCRVWIDDYQSKEPGQDDGENLSQKLGQDEKEDLSQPLGQSIVVSLVLSLVRAKTLNRRLRRHRLAPIRFAPNVFRSQIEPSKQSTPAGNQPGHRATTNS